MDFRSLLDLTFARRDPTILYVEPEMRLVSGTGATVEPSLIQAALAGNPDGHRTLFRLHAPYVHRLIRRLVPHGQDTEDLVQVVFIEAFRSLRTFRGDSSFTTWLTRIAVRVAMKRGRWDQLRFVPLSDDDRLATGAPSAESTLESRRALSAFQRILGDLSEKRRTVFVLHVLEGLALEEVATLVDAKVGAVKVRLHDARLEIEKHARRDPDLRRFLGWKE